MATARMALGSIFGAITNTADSVGNLFQAGSTGVSILNRYVDHHAHQQVIKHKIEMHDYLQTVMEESSIAKTERLSKISDYLSEKPERKEIFTKHYEDLSNLFTEK